MDTKICTKCKKELPLTSFYSRGNGKYRSECKECHRGYVKAQYRKRKDEINNLKKQCVCQKCGEKRFYLLDFHHVNPEIKDDTIAKMASNRNKMEDIQKEIDKCVVLCSNCHREFHYLEREKGITLKDYIDLSEFEKKSVLINY